MGTSEGGPEGPAPTGQLAHSGSDAAVTWTLTGAGALLVLGTTLVAVHRTRNNRSSHPTESCPDSSHGT
ncbi:hypothetical protein [Streptomyces sp. NPDC048659]|uniref:hypothetical protein n=1 Tax=Streptomyces sp. NPDC048659 TaxID=3155489 RepID=UPI00341B8863